MKKFIMRFISIVICNYGFSQFEIGLLPKIGYNVVDIEKSTNLSKYGNTTSGYYLNDWDQLNYGGTLYGLFQKDKKVNFGGEITFNRLYYWEEAYESYYGLRYNWGDVSTIGFGVLAKYAVSEIFYLKPVISLEYYLYGSGLNFGTALAGGVDIRLSES